METALRSETSYCGNSSAASFDAEYTDAPASLTTIYAVVQCGISRRTSAVKISVSFEAVPLPMAMICASYVRMRCFSVCFAASR